MKFIPSYLLLLGITLLVFKQASATHYRAGVITYTIIGNQQIQATITIFSKVSGQSIFADRDAVPINWGDGTVDTIGRINGPTDPMTNYPHYGVLVCPDVKENIYVGTHQYAGVPPLPDNFFIISFFDDNRIAGIANISAGNSVDVPFYMEDTIWFGNINTVGLDNSPVFLNSPCDYANVNDTFTFNPVAYDADGDSMSFELMTPLAAQGQDVPQYQYPDEYCNALGDPGGEPSTESMDPFTGQYMWAVPCVTGFFNIASLVKTFRCGTELGTVEMDMQIIVLQDSDSAPEISTVHDTVISPGETIQWQFTASDPNTADTVSLVALGGAFSLSTDAPVFQTVPGNPATGTLTWKPDDYAMRPNAYIFSVYAADNFLYEGGNAASLSNSSTFRVWVADTEQCAATAGITAITENKFFVSLYPNPSSGICKLQVTDELVGTKMEITDATGRVIYTSAINSTASVINLNAAAGIYFLHIFSPVININKKFIRL